VTSNIDDTKPGTGLAFTADVRANFTIAKQEITNLQNIISGLQNDIAALKERSQTAVGLVTDSPPNTTSTVYVTAGVGVEFTPTTGTRAVIILSGQLGNLVNNGTSDLQLVYGTGNLPAFGTLLTNTNGVLIGGEVNVLATKPNDIDPFSVNALLTNLVTDNLYWVGVVFKAGGSGTATLSEMSLTAFEVIDPLP
jgi:hypothetical protein